MGRSGIKAIVFDIDGVITDGKRYMDGKGGEFKSVNLKDLDAISSMKNHRYIIGAITGEDTPFSRKLREDLKLDVFELGCKDKLGAIQRMERQYQLSPEQICYIGDGKYDIPVIKYIGLGICPHDAIGEVKEYADVILQRDGGQGCMAEIHTLLKLQY